MMYRSYDLTFDGQLMMDDADIHTETGPSENSIYNYTEYTLYCAALVLSTYLLYLPCLQK